jgi:uncharacterized protein
MEFSAATPCYYIINQQYLFHFSNQTFYIMETLPPPPQPMNAEDERLWSVLAHLGALFSSFMVPLVIFLLYKDRSEYVASHAKEALNFQISMIIYSAIAGFLCITIIGLIIGIPMLILIGILHFVFCLIATIKASNNELYNYPLTIKII